MKDVHRGEIWWADLGEPLGWAPGFRRPVVVVQNDVFNRSLISTVLCVALTSSMNRSRGPGNVVVASAQSGLAADSVANVTNVVTVDRAELHDRVGALTTVMMKRIDEGMRLALDL